MPKIDDDFDEKMEEIDKSIKEDQRWQAHVYCDTLMFKLLGLNLEDGIPSNDEIFAAKLKAIFENTEQVVAILKKEVEIILLRKNFGYGRNVAVGSLVLTWTVLDSVETTDKKN